MSDTSEVSDISKLVMAKSAKEKISFDDILHDIRKQKFAPLYFFYGEEDFLIDEVADALVANAVDPASRQFNLDIVYGNDVDGKDIVALASSFPMMGERRVVIVRDFERATELDPFLPYIEHPSPSTSLFLSASKVDMRKKVYAHLKKNAVGGEAVPLREHEIPAWVQKRAAVMGTTIAPEAAEMLRAYVGTALRELNNELEKLRIAVGSKAAIETGDVQSVVGMSREFSIFELTRAVGEKNLSKALSICSRMMEVGEAPVGMVAMLTRHFGILWRVHQLNAERKTPADMAKTLGVHPYFFKEYLEDVKRYPRPAVEDALLALARADEQLKTSSGDPHVVMDVLLYTIAGSRLPQSSPAFV
ncbi:MAG: DNA polymerase III subunit delta [Bacteroidota bacterium]|nr:DNA polymerase III subunit delta [Bacteroidota bacterium]